MQKLLTLMFLLAGYYLQAQQYVPRTYTPNDRIYDLERKGDTLFAVGGFTYVGVETGGAGWFEDSLPYVNFPVIDGSVRAVIGDGQGGWYVGGDFDEAGDQPCENLVHVLADGTVDGGFLPNVNNEIYALAIWNDTMMVAGRFLDIDGQARERLASFDLNSGQLTNWNPGASNTVQTLAIVNGDLYAGGLFARIGGRHQPGLARLSIQTGALLPTHSPAFGAINAFALEGDRLYAGGNFSGSVGRYTGRASAFTNFNDEPEINFPRFQGTVRAIIEDGTGGWYVGGDFSQVDAQSFSRLVHLLPTGEIDPAFLPGATGSIYALELLNDTLFLGGTFQTIGGQTRRRLAAVNATTGALLPWNPDADNTVLELVASGPYIFAGGSFNTIGGLQQNKLAVLGKMSGIPLQTPGPVSGQVKALELSGDRLYAGGSFTGASGLAASRLAWLADSSSVPSAKFPAFGGTVNVSIPDGNGGWYVGGSFFTVNGVILRRLAHILPDSTLDPGFDFNINNTVNDLALFNDTILLVGNFTSIDGQTRERVAAIDLNTNTLFNWSPSVNANVNTLARVGQTLYLGGSFTSVDGQSRNRAAAFDMSSGALSAWDPDFNNEVNRQIWNDSMLLVMGRFTTAGGLTRNRLAAIAPGTGATLAWDPDVNNEVNDGEIDGTTLYIGGSFTQIGGQARQRLAAVDLATAAVQAWDPGASTTVQTLAISGNQLYVGGNFLQLDGQDRLRAASFDLPAGTLTSWAPEASSTVMSFGIDGNQILMGGNFTVLKTQTRTRFLAMETNGFGLLPNTPEPNNVVNDIQIWNDTMLLAGAFTSIDGQSRSRLALIDTGTYTIQAWDPGANGTVEAVLRWNDTMMVAGGFGQLGGLDRAHMGALSLNAAAPIAWNPEPDNDVLALGRMGNAVIAGGLFSILQAESRNKLMCVDVQGDSITAWDPGISGIIGAPQARAIATSPSGVWVGGSFGTIGDSSRQNLALTDPITGVVLPVQASIDDRVYALLARGDSLWVGGRFDSIQGQFRGNVAVLSHSTGQLSAYAPNANADTYTFGWNDTMMVVGGDFSHLVGRERKGGYAYDTRTGSLLPWNPDLGQNDFITSIEIDPKGGKAYLGGSFDEVHGLLRHNLARVDIEMGMPDSWQQDANFLVHDMAWDPSNQDLYVGGNFTEVGTQTRNYLARIGADGLLASFDPSPNGQVYTLAWNDTMMFAAGAFNTIGGAARNGIVAMNRNGQVDNWSPLVAGLSGLQAGVAAIEVTADRIYLGGNFRQINGFPRNRLAAFDRETGTLLPWRIPVDSSVNNSTVQINQIKARDQQLFVTGIFSEINGTLSENFAWIDGKSGLVQGMRTQINNLIYDIEILDSLVYFGGDFFVAEGDYSPNLAGYSFPAPVFEPQKLSLSPQEGGNDGDLSMQIFGSGFTSLPTVILRRTGLPDIVAMDSLTRIFFGDQIRATFNLRNQPVGFRDVWLIGQGDTLILEDAFEVVNGTGPQVWAKVVQPPFIRFNPNSPGHNLILNYGNTGTIDAEGVPVWLALSPDITLADIDLEFLPLPPGTLAAGDTILPFVPVDTIRGKAVEAVVYGMVLSRVPAGFQGSIVFRVKPDTTGDFFVAAWATDPLYGSPLKYAVGACMDALIGKIIGLVPGGDCVYNGLDALLSPIFDAALDPDFGSAQYAANYAWTLGGAIVDCGILATGGGLVLDILKDILNYKSLFDDLVNLKDCIDSFEPDPEEDQIRVTASCDPNQKGGLPGVGEPRWIQPKEPLPYLVEFENLEDATAPAVEVRIEDALDTQVLDLSTLELRFFTLADTLIEIPAGRQSWKQMVDLRPRLDVLVRVSAELDTLSGVLYWRFEGLDPATLQPLDGALDGFLPPNLNDPEGRGSVAYRVDLLPGLATGTPVANSADIYFDFNPPIITNTWLNTVDVDAPESAVYALDSVQNTLSFPLSWIGTDVGSGVKAYDLYVSTDGGPFLRELRGLLDTTIDFSGEAGRTYAFYTLATDSVGNVESAPLQGDAETRIAGSASLEQGVKGWVQLVPNPNRGRFEVVLQELPVGAAHLRLYDMSGRTLLSRDFRITEGHQRIPIQADLAPGIYVLGLEQAGRFWHQRMVVK